jgi:hypothetical protein
VSERGVSERGVSEKAKRERQRREERTGHKIFGIQALIGMAQIIQGKFYRSEDIE